MNILGLVLAGDTGLNPVDMTVRATWYTMEGPTLGQATIGLDGTFDLELTDPPEPEDPIDPPFDDPAHLDRQVMVTLFDGATAKRIGPFVLTLEEIDALTEPVTFTMIDDHRLLAVGTLDAGTTGVVTKDMVLRAHWNGANGALLGEGVVEDDGAFACEMEAPESEPGLDEENGREVIFTLWDGVARLPIDPAVYALGELGRRLTLSVKSATAVATPRVHGKLTTTGAEPLAGYDVRVIGIGYRSQVPIAHAKTSPAGVFDIPYLPRTGGLDLFVTAVVEGEEDDQVIAQSQTFYGVRGDLQVDLVVSEDAFKIRQPEETIEWEWIDGVLSVRATGESEEVEAEDIVYLSRTTGISEELVKLWFNCADAGGEEGDPVLTPEVLWGLFRQGLPDDPVAAASLPESRIEEMLTAAVEAHQINEDAYTSAAAVYAAIKQMVAGEIVSALGEEDPEDAPPPSVASESLRRVQDLLTVEGQQEAFVGYVLGRNAPESFGTTEWNGLATAMGVPNDDSVIIALQRRLDLVALGRGSVGFAQAAEADASAGARPVLAGLTVTEMAAITDTIDVEDLPDGMTSLALARDVTRQLSAQYPELSFAGRYSGAGGVDGKVGEVMEALAGENVSLRAGPVDLTPYVTELEWGLETPDNDEVIARVLALQSFIRTTDDADYADLLVKAQYRSLGDIERTAPSKFMASVRSAASTTTDPPSNEELDKLSRHFHTQSRGAGVQKAVIRSLGKYKEEDSEETPSDPNAYVNWRNLFGSPDTCECDQCLSVFSPAAYLVNTLEYLDQATDGGQDDFFERRPDLLNLDLTCENTYTEVPYIDLANEILEYKVQPEESPLTAERIETEGDSAARRRMPQSIHLPAYVDLSAALVPWRLPFDLPRASAQEACAAAGVSYGAALEEVLLGSPCYPWDRLKETVTTGDEVFRYACERLGLQPGEEAMLRSTVAADEESVEVTWGEELDDSVRQFLDRSALSYDELVELLDTTFIGKYAPHLCIHVEKSPCDLDTQEILGLTPKVRESVQRFCRLRGHLGTSVHETDLLLTALGLQPATNTLFAVTPRQICQLATALDVKEAFDAPWDEIAALWADLDAGVVRGRRRLYDRLFADVEAQLSVSIGVHVAVVAEKLGADRDSLKELVESHCTLMGIDPSFLEVSLTEGNLNETLSAVQRLWWLKTHLEVSIEEFAAIDELFRTVDPTANLFSPTHPDRILQALILVQQSRTIGVPLLELMGLVRDGVLTAPYLPQDVAVRAGEKLEASLELNPPLPAGSPSETPLAAIFRYLERGRLAAAAATLHELMGYPVEALDGGELTAAEALVDRFFEQIGVERPGDVAIPEISDWQTYFPPLLEASLIARSRVRAVREVATSLFGLDAETVVEFVAGPTFVSFPLPSFVTGLTSDDSADRDEALAALDRMAYLARVLGWRKAEFLGYANVAEGASLPALRYLPAADAGADVVLRFGALVSVGKRVPGLMARMSEAPDTQATAATLGVTHTALKALDIFTSGTAGDLRMWLQLYRAVGICKSMGAATWNASLGQAVEVSGSDLAARSVGGSALVAQTCAALTAAGEPAKATGLVDRLRERRRDALLTFVLRQEELRTSDELFGRLLVDVETQSCMTTSRIRLAMSSVQLFIDRIALGMEGDLSLDPEMKDQWTRRRRYRLWEAQMKAFVFPENYLRPDLRDDKSFFFQELEDEVSSSGLNADKIERAVGAYVHRLRALAAPDVRAIGEQIICTDPRMPDDVQRRAVHVVARTASNPHEYFHRIRYQNSEASGADEGWWTPWAPLPNGLTGDHFLCIERPGRGIRLIWAECSEPKSENYLANAWLYNGNTTIDGTVWTTRLGLHWMDYRRSGWSAPKSASGKFDVSLGECFGADDRTFVSLKAMFERFGPLSLLHLSAGNVKHNGVDEGDVAVECRVPILVALTTGWAMAGSGPLDPEFVSSEKKIRFSNVFAIPSYDEEIGRSLYVPIDATDPSRLRRAYPILDVPGDMSAFRLAFNRVIYAQDAWGLRFGESDFDVVGSYAGVVADPSELILAHRNHAVFLRRMDGNTSGRQWWAHPVYHAGADRIREVYTEGGVDRLYFSPSSAAYVQSDSSSPSSFIGTTPSYTFDGNLHGHVEGSEVQHIDVDYSVDSAYGPYNWELFYHIPMLIADRLRTEQQFDQARRWLEAVFDPFQAKTEFPGIVTMHDGLGPERAWRFRQFARHAQDGMLRGQSTQLDSFQIRQMQWDPYSPHRVAREVRPDAFAKAAVLRYIELFVEWADGLFREDTLETINEATQRYLVARMLLGERPRQLPGTAWLAEEDGTLIEQEDPQTLLSEQLGLQPTVAEDLKGDGESGFYYRQRPLESRNVSKDAPRILGIIELPKLHSSFCVPPNPRLIALWDIIEDRLLKIRSCRNIDGVRRDLPLFEPELLDEWERRAAALGTTVAEAMGEAEDFPAQRFMASVQRALEFAQEVRGLSSQLLQAFEKRDGEQLAQVRATHERAMASAVLAVRKEQRAEATRQLDGLRQSRAAIDERHSFYANVERVSADEQASLDQAKAANQLTLVSHSMSAIGAEVSLIAQSGVPPQFGGLQLGQSMSAISSVFAALSSYQSWLSSMSATNASHRRRWDDWKLQERTSAAELRSMDRQILAAEIRLAIANREVSNQEMQVEFARESEEFLTSKFTNTELYSWMVEQVRGLYGEAWRLAVEMARRAERAYRFERCLGDETVSVTDGRWNSLREGLLAPERLIGELRRMEASWIKTNQREYELVEHFSLASVAPLELARLRAEGVCDIKLPEVLFDLQCPGHYFRRVRSVALTIPGVVGPNTSVHCKLTLTKSAIRLNQRLVTGDDPLGTLLTLSDDDRVLVREHTPVSAMVTSTGSRDTGVVEAQDDRYLPFEGAGAVSEWSLEILNRETPTFDPTTITDAVLHVTYTAREGSDEFRGAAELKAGAHVYEGGFFVRTQFPDAWKVFSQSEESSPTLPLLLDGSVLPWCPPTKDLLIESLHVVPVKDGAPVPTDATLTLPEDELVSGEDTVDGVSGEYATDFSLVTPAIVGPPATPAIPGITVASGHTYELSFGTEITGSVGSNFDDLWIFYRFKRVDPPAED